MPQAYKPLSTYVLNEATHASLGNATATEYLDSIPCGVLRGASGMHLQQTNWTSKLLRLLLIRL